MFSSARSLRANSTSHTGSNGRGRAGADRFVEVDDDPAASGDAELNLKQAAARLGVHYMTAYRYVRQGRLRARRAGTEWRVPPDAVEEFRRDAAASSVATRDAGAVGSDGASVRQVDWAERLVEPLLAGDEPAAWSVVQRALAAGRDPEFCYLDVIAEAIAIIDRRRADGELNAAQQPLATAVAYRLTARLGASFRRPGRSRGRVVFGAPLGERHSLPLAIVADLVRLEGFDVLELGADTPAEAFAAAAQHAKRLVAVGLSITGIEHLDAARATVAAIRAVDPAIPIVVGGQAVLNPEIGALLDADAWAPDGRTASAVIARLAARAPSTLR